MMESLVNLWTIVIPLTPSKTGFHSVALDVLGLTVNQASLELRSTCSTSRVLGLMACTTTAQLQTVISATSSH